MQDTFSLPRELTIYTVGELAPQCMAWLEADTQAESGGSAAHDFLHVDAQAVQEIDAAGVQLLLSFSNAMTRRHRRLQLVRPSPTLLEACKALGANGLVADAPLTEETA